jgi:hypothetical protein
VVSEWSSSNSSGGIRIVRGCRIGRSRRDITCIDGRASRRLSRRSCRRSADRSRGRHLKLSQHREPIDRFVALRSHYLFDSIFTASRGRMRTGGMEGEVGRLRRKHLVPVPQVGSIGQLNRPLADACEHDLGRRIAGAGHGR